MLDTDPVTPDPATPTVLMPTLTGMARPETPPPDLDKCKDIVVKWYKSVFGFTNLVATALYDEQLLKDKDSLAELNDNEVDNVMRVIRRHHAIAELSSARLKLAIFWIKHQNRTQREIGVPGRSLVTIKPYTMLLLKTQKQLEDEWRLCNKEPDYPVQTLNLALAAKTFNKNKDPLVPRARSDWRTPHVSHPCHTLPTSRVG